MIEVIVYGLPAPQGSKRHIGRGIMVESSKSVKPWREAVKQAVLLTYPFRLREDPVLVRGPVSMEVVFTMPRPKSAKRGAVPQSRPDLSKLVRSTEDALTDIGAWEDDSRIVDSYSSKVYVGDPRALPAPGAVVRIIQVVPV